MQYTTNSHTPPTLRLFQSGLLLLLLCASWVAHADTEQNRWYNVEVIIFSQKSQQFRNSEVWPVDVTLPDMKNARALLPASRTGAFTLLSSKDLRLGGEARRIQNAPELELLLHEGWRQPGLPENRAVAVQVHAGKLGDTSDVSTKYRMEGTLKLVLSRYLHIKADLLYREALPDSAETATAPSSDSSPEQADSQMTGDNLFAQAAGEAKPHYRIYRLQQSRRMRSNELHYLDNPVLGMIIRVTPI